MCWLQSKRVSSTQASFTSTAGSSGVCFIPFFFRHVGDAASAFCSAMWSTWPSKGNYRIVYKLLQPVTKKWYDLLPCTLCWWKQVTYSCSPPWPPQWGAQSSCAANVARLSQLEDPMSCGYCSWGVSSAESALQFGLIFSPNVDHISFVLRKPTWSFTHSINVFRSRLLAQAQGWAMRIWRWVEHGPCPQAAFRLVWVGVFDISLVQLTWPYEKYHF